MAFDVDEEILQDFLIEAGEILELLQEQLVALENNPDDTDLLNAIFRGFHTVKGGAGFLSLTPMVDVCHEAENTFDLLRTGKRSVTAELMDIILQAVDAINRTKCVTIFRDVLNKTLNACYLVLIVFDCFCSHPDYSLAVFESQYFCLKVNRIACGDTTLKSLLQSCPRRITISIQPLIQAGWLTLLFRNFENPEHFI